MVDLPRIPVENSVTEAPRSTVSGAEVTSAFNALARGLNAAFGSLEQSGVEEAQYEGQAAVYRDEKGATRFTPRSNWTASGKAFNRSARTAALAQASADTRARLAQMRIEANGDVGKFQSMADAYRNEMISRQDKIMLGPMKIMLDTEIGQELTGLREQQFRADTVANEKAIRTQVEGLDGEMAALARDGGTATPEYRKKMADMKALMGELVGNPLFGFNQREADATLKRMEDQHTSQWILGRTEDAFTQGGAPAATKFVEEELSNPNLTLTPAEREKYKRLGRGQINALKANARGEIRDFRQSISSILDGLKNGKPQSDELIDAAIERGTELGDGITVLKLKQARAEFHWTHDFGLKNNREQAGDLSRMLGRDLPVVTGRQAGRASEAKLDGVNPDLLSTFKLVQNQFGQSIPIVSGFRDAATNAKAGGARRSQHLHGNALDLDVSKLSKQERIKLIEIASANGITGIGVYNNSLHFDLGAKRAWGPRHNFESTPPWAMSAITRHLGGVAKASVASDTDSLFGSVVRVESGFDPNAVSYKGAAGLAQVMPGTARGIAQELGDPNFPYGGSDEQVRDYLIQNKSERSLTYGRYYLDKMLKRYKGDAQAALVAYNAGPGVADKWLAAGRDGSVLPAETKNYVSKVLSRSGGGDVDVGNLKTARKEVAADLKDHLSTLEKGVGRGLVLETGDTQLLMQQLSLVGDQEDYQRAEAILGPGGLAEFSNENLATQDANMQAMMEGGLTPDEYEVYKRKLEIHNRTEDTLKSDPLQLAAQNPYFGENLEPLDPTTPESFAESLRKRQRSVEFIASRYGVETGAFRPHEVETLTAGFAKMDASRKVALLFAMKNALPKDTYMRSIGQIAPKASPATAYAGAFVADDPETAKTILLGEQALQLDPKFGPKPKDDETEDFDTALPLSAFDPSAASLYQATTEAAKAYYAAKSQEASDNSGKFNVDRWNQSVVAVTGGLVEMNGQMTVAPKRGMGQSEFDELIASVTDADIAGMYQSDGKPYRLEDFRRYAQLVTVGNGKYRVRIKDGVTGAPTDIAPYARGNSLGGRDYPFVLDLTDKGRAKALSSYNQLKPPPSPETGTGVPVSPPNQLDDRNRRLDNPQSILDEVMGR